VRPTRLRSGLLSAAFAILAIVGWIYLAPTQIDGTTSYVVTSGKSMEPSFHTGDLALVRPADHYRIGEVVAYHSTLLHVTVLHRIVGERGGRYVFKGDNNNFIDPTRPTRDGLVGALWLRVPHGGRVMAWLHTPLTAAALTGFAALLVLSAFATTKRRGNRPKRANEPGRQGGNRMTNQNHGARFINVRTLLIASVVAMGAFLSLALIAFNRPVHRTTTVSTPYTQHVTFGYHATAPAGPVYPRGVVTTGQPIFLALVHRVRVRIDYLLTSSAGGALLGNEQVALRLTGPTGWSRTLPAVAVTHFHGTHASAVVTLDLTQIRSLLSKIQKLTGITAGDGYTIAVVPKIHVSGVLAGEPLDTNFGPTLNFQLQSLQLQPGGGSDASSSLTPSQRGTVSGPTITDNTLAVAGHSASVQTIRWVALGGFVLAAVIALVAFVLKRGQPFEEAARIQEQYGHLMVPIINAEDLGWPPIDVGSIKALVRLAQSGDRLILHHCGNGVDTYLVNEEGTVYRYQARPIKIVWQEWATAPVDASSNGDAEANANGHADANANGNGNGIGTLEVLAPEDS
jgi:signal peptidase I